jgi:hypothetical protein
LEKEMNDSRQMNIALITLDSLRYDSALEAKTPNLNAIFTSVGIENWVKVGSQGTHTLASHISMLHAGILPSWNTDDVPGPYNRKKENLFKAQLPWDRKTDATYPTPPASNIVIGFKELGYRTVGIGGVHWFDNRFVTSGFWEKNYFEEFHWEERFAEEEPDGLEYQIDLAQNLLKEEDDRPLFFFLNISSTHIPYRNGPRNVQGQAACLEYVDSHLPRLLSLLPNPCHVIIVSDHGDCMGEDGLWGHAVYHPKVMEVPMVSFILDLNHNELLEKLAKGQILNEKIHQVPKGKVTRELKRLWGKYGPGSWGGRFGEKKSHYTNTLDGSEDE